MTGARDAVVIVCATDVNYVRPMTVMLRSALANLCPDRTASIHIVDGGVSAADRDMVERSLQPGRATIHWVRVSESRYSGMPLWGRMRVSTYFKLALTDVLPAHADRAIWLDCDLLVVSDLSRLWDTSLEGRHLIAAQDSIVPLVSSTCGIVHHERLGIARGAKYFNAGVMLVDVERWRGDGTPERVLAYLREFHDSVYFWDQEGLNAVLAGKWGELDPRWNQNANLPRSRRHPFGGSSNSAANGDAWIIHFAGNVKPWRYPGSDPKRLLYFRYLDETAWSGWRPAPSVAGLMIETYESSRVRGWLYPAERWAMRLVRRLSRSNVAAFAGDSEEQKRTAAEPATARRSQ